MSTLVKQVSGKAAKQWIDDAIITRIKVALRHSDKTVSEIADEMCFPNSSFFCKYFKRLTGMTTQAYRAGR
jgi:AraC-like DNA-binding protein